MNSKATPSPAIEGDMVNVEDFGAAKAAVRADKTTKPSVFIDQLTFSDGQKINLKQNDIVVFVGPNNSGKSLALREINASLARADHKGLVITGLTYQRVGTESDLIKWLESTSTINNAREGNPTYQGFEYGFKRGLVEDRWKPEATGLTELARFFCTLINAEQRLSAANPPGNIKITTEPPSHPIHYMQKDDKVEEKVSKLFKKAFGTDLIVHRNAGSEVPLFVGSRPTPPTGGDRVSPAYLANLEKLPRLEKQGDGMRSYTGVLLNALILDRSIILLDEPEAFLHPPQARLIGNMLATERTNNSQIFVATHSRDVLHGLIDANSKNVRVVRIKREGDVNHISELDNKGIRELWDDPILRYSNALNGIFHQHVVICEGDADCRFYQAMSDVLYADQEATKQPDALFIHSGGKQRISQLVKAMQGLDVPTTVIADFDVLNAENPLALIVKAAGGDWSKLQADWKIIKAHVDSLKPELLTQDVQREIEKVLKAVTANNFPSNAADEIKATLRRSSPWQGIKTAGKNGLPSGDASKAFVRLDEALRALGIFVVPVGQLESFDKTVGNHGPKWVNEVLVKDLKNDTSLKEAREFISTVFKDI